MNTGPEPLVMSLADFQTLLSGRLEDSDLSLRGLLGINVALESPRIDVRLKLHDEMRGTSIVGGLTPEVALLGVPREPSQDILEVIVMQPSALPAQVAALVGLGPRPPHAMEGALWLGEDVVAHLRAGASDEATARATCEALGPLPDPVMSALQAALMGQRIHWQLECAPSGQDGMNSEQCEVIDVGPAGMWTLMASPFEQDVEVHASVMMTATPRIIWRLLVDALVTSLDEATVPSPALA